MLYDSVESLLGHTPLVRLSRAARALGAPDRLFGIAISLCSVSAVTSAPTLCGK